MFDADELIPRRALHVAARKMAASRGLVITGPRQSGKTELLHMLRRKTGGTFLSLDDPATLAAARSDPVGFITGFDSPIFIDEVQRGGDPLLLAIKAALDTSRSKGQVVMAGSTRFLTEPRLSESLAGRVRFVDMWPLSQDEIDHNAGAQDGTLDELGTFIDRAFTLGHDLHRSDVQGLTRHEIMSRVCRGGYPEAVLFDDATDRRDFFTDYVRTITARDIRLIQDIADIAALRRLVKLTAARTSGELNVTDFARSAGASDATCRRYLRLLEAVFLHHLVPAWSRNLTAKVRRRPKLHMTDTGLAAHLMGLSPTALANPLTTASGPLLETFVASELARQITWSRTDVEMFHWSDRSGPEVDLVLESPDGRIVAIEVKAAVSANEADAKWLRLLRDRTDTNFVVGMILHAGDRPMSLGDRIISMPISALWDPALGR